MEFGTFIMAPGNRHFDNFELLPMGQKQDFGIKAPAIDSLERENRLRCLVREGFEAALRVAIGKQEDRTQIKIEDAGQQLARQWLSLELKRGIKPSRTNGHVGPG